MASPGLNDVIPRSSPVQVPGTWKVIVQPNDYHRRILLLSQKKLMEHYGLGVEDYMPLT